MSLLAGLAFIWVSLSNLYLRNKNRKLREENTHYKTCIDHMEITPVSTQDEVYTLEDFIKDGVYPKPKIKKYVNNEEGD